LTFYQFVPNGAATAVAAVRTQDIRDAVYHTGKAFWLADPQNYEISSAKGKTRMEYTFTGTGAKSMWEDHLLCASGDYPEVNLEPWAGEARHPYFSLWKVNEIGARGVGEQRLEELADSVVSIRAFDASGTEITAD
jgi:hypothetical protein